MTFKDYALADRSVFVNPNEHGSSHTINGRSVPLTIDNDQLQHRTKVEFDGLVVGDMLFYVRAEDLGFEPKPDQALLFDGVPCHIADRREADGMYEIILAKNVR